MNTRTVSLLILVLCLLLHLIDSLDTLAPNGTVKDGDVLISQGRRFALGFFSPGNSSLRYVGIWYYGQPERTVVWVANRENPVNDTSGVLAIDRHGNLVINEKSSSFPIWSANVSSMSSNDYATAQLLDTGNLVLKHDLSEVVIWQSFDYPTDTFLPSMKLGLDRRTGLNWFLTSWKSEDDPAPGSFSYRFEPTGYPQLFVYKDRAPYWRGGAIIEQLPGGAPEMTNDFISNLTIVNNATEVSLMYGVINASVLTRYVVHESGFLKHFMWQDEGQRWTEFNYHPKELCDYYSKCGPNGNCGANTADQFDCTCLPGFEPKSPGDWYLRDGTGGCKRRQNVSLCRSGEGFVKVKRLKLPDTSTAHVNMSLSLKECEQECLRDCNCMAYAIANKSMGEHGCLKWYGDLVDTRAYSDLGEDLYVRVDAIDLARYRKRSSLVKKAVVAAISVSALLLLLLGSLMYCLLLKRKRADRRGRNPLVSVTTSSTYCDELPGLKDLDSNGRRKTDLPLFHFGTVAAATNNFSSANELGQGGFGSVYKGVVDNGTEVAVKRLSKYSGQGNEEFKNEVRLIAKLQHRNLVKILGCCIQEDEKLLIYEYLPNKSLDSFLFDDTKRSLLDWGKRFDIAYGVARGLMYLHQDSTLRIIHRDLKASNVLLDVALKPKISDFGIARICGGDQIEGKTKRVVGTYGYMAPEYAIQGRFSIKSDVYSYGVLLLEIITGQRNSGCYHLNPCCHLIGHVWQLWKEGKCMEIVDKSMDKTYSDEEMVSRCIQIGFLCVQRYALDRPTMSTVVFMLGNADAVLPTPKQPAFIDESSFNGDIQSTCNLTCSVNGVTNTVVEAR
ncbi:G-type lectin S-receptor-like serine/threonine-protein kinase RKS1 [Rhodamnia argentea]|uniref:Receptor-like serine/threonine-protein kinase n=1 Tax=Rhodamnia argentea TaxID=178133 RepID=A0A8B8P248_9MYRT|nr:G-type lectin S-receptor-like serine/threonine-protein kinase RKS1 [Rhodamnia argentea]